MNVIDRAALFAWMVTILTIVVEAHPTAAQNHALLAIVALVLLLLWLFQDLFLWSVLPLVRGQEADDP